MTPRKPGRRTSGAPSSNSRRGKALKVWLAALFLVVFLLGSLVLLDQARRWYLAPEAPPETPATAQAPVPVAAPSAGQVREVIEEWLQSRGERKPVRLSGGPENWTAMVPASQPDPAGLKGLAGVLERSGGVRVGPAAEGCLPLYRDGRPWGSICFQPPPATPAQGEARVAIVVDDLGRNLGTLRSLLAIDLPLTLSIIPGEPHATESAQMAHRAGHEVLIHIPMEPQGYPAVNPGRDALFVDATPDELQRRFRGYLKKVPYAVGGNNHMGSRFTEDPAGMAVVLAEMRKAGLFFLDSRTSGRSVGYALALRAGIPAASRDVFLDNVQDPEKISGQILRLLDLARRQGSAIGICHPHAATLAALRRARPLLEAAGVEMVPVSRLVHEGAANQ